jgi:hypothetical protein
MDEEARKFQTSMKIFFSIMDEKRNMKSLSILSVIFMPLFLFSDVSSGAADDWKTLAPPDSGELWVQPVQGKPARPVWGHLKGIRVGLSPMPGPRGLLRIYAPYLGQEEHVMINFIAVEPIIEEEAARGFSELEISQLDQVQGKRFWSANTPDDESPKLPQFPSRGVVEKKDGIQTLTVYLFVEPFQNGARVYLRLQFRSDRPYELGLATFTQKDSKPIKQCILTATMGNYARLRRLYLKDFVKSSLEIWPDFKGDGFASHAVLPLQDIIRTTSGHALFIAAPDEKDPQHAAYAPDTYFWWKYQGKPATQYWRSENPHPGLVGMVNGRALYWQSQFPLPGGVAFENFELVESFRQGAEYWFGASPLSPEELKKKEE